MRVLAPPPAQAFTTQVTDGYQLCARCGEVLIEGEVAVLVRRLCFWLIYAHELGPHCPPKAVRGWLAARKADAMRNIENKEMFRTGEPYRLNGVLKPCVCILDDRHIEAELALVEYQFSDEVPMKGDDLRSLLSHFHLQMFGGGKRTLAQSEPETRTGGKGTHQIVVRNLVEDDVLAAIDKGCLTKNIQVWIDTVWSCRKATYATFRIAPRINSNVFVGRIHKIRQVRVRERKKTRLPKAPLSVLSWDANGRPAEFALYSKRKVLRLNGKLICEFEAWAPKPKPVDLPFSSRINPELYIWKPSFETASKPVDQSNPYGPVAILNPADVAALNGQ